MLSLRQKVRQKMKYMTRDQLITQAKTMTDQDRKDLARSLWIGSEPCEINPSPESNLKFWANMCGGMHKEMNYLPK